MGALLARVYSQDDTAVEDEEEEADESTPGPTPLPSQCEAASSRGGRSSAVGVKPAGGLGELDYGDSRASLRPLGTSASLPTADAATEGRAHRASTRRRRRSSLELYETRGRLLRALQGRIDLLDAVGAQTVLDHARRAHLSLLAPVGDTSTSGGFFLALRADLAARVTGSEPPPGGATVVVYELWRKHSVRSLSAALFRDNLAAAASLRKAAARRAPPGISAAHGRSPSTSHFSSRVADSVRRLVRPWGTAKEAKAEPKGEGRQGAGMQSSHQGSPTVADDAQRRSQIRRLRTDIARMQRELLRLEGALPSTPSMDVTALGESESESEGEGEDGQVVHGGVIGAGEVADVAQAAASMTFMTTHAFEEGEEEDEDTRLSAATHTAYAQV